MALIQIEIKHLGGTSRWAVKGTSVCGNGTLAIVNPKIDGVTRVADICRVVGEVIENLIEEDAKALRLLSRWEAESVTSSELGHD